MPVETLMSLVFQAIAAGGVLLVFWQLLEIRKSRILDAVHKVFDKLDSEEQVPLRYFVYNDLISPPGSLSKEDQYK